jgi:hypothetical protein
LIFAKSKVIIAHEMWMNAKRVCKQLHKNKKTISKVEKWKGKTCGGYAHL